DRVLTLDERMEPNALTAATLARDVRHGGDLVRLLRDREDARLVGDGERGDDLIVSARKLHACDAVTSDTLWVDARQLDADDLALAGDQHQVFAFLGDTGHQQRGDVGRDQNVTSRLGKTLTVRHLDSLIGERRPPDAFGQRS